MTDEQVAAPKPAAGWFPAPDASQRLRYWDGENWTESYRPALTTSDTAGSPHRAGHPGEGSTEPNTASLPLRVRHLWRQSGMVARLASVGIVAVFGLGGGWFALSQASGGDGTGTPRLHLNVQMSWVCASGFPSRVQVYDGSGRAVGSSQDDGVVADCVDDPEQFAPYRAEWRLSIPVTDVDQYQVILVSLANGAEQDWGTKSKATLRAQGWTW